ncbi:MAG: FtsW/RodA/SpoVE family cell cycle protein [Chloroflexota bacterium]|nr:FtsW/RodA/SpoVE family cell cycle protein [Chloroflexota bacterium]MYB15842.1 stage V sporulation protein E [Chloroflexota bacterium]
MDAPLRRLRTLSWEDLSWPANDSYLLALVVIVPLLGAVMIVSANMPFAGGDGDLLSGPVMKQLGILMGGLVLAVTVSFVDYHAICARWAGLYTITVLALLGVLVFGYVSDAYSARWYEIGGLTVQPSELAKPVLIVSLSALAWQFRERIATLPVFAKGVLVSGVPIVLVMLQPDLSTSLTLAIAAMAVGLAAGVRLRYLVLSVTVFVTFAVVLMLARDLDYQIARISAFLDPANSQSANYQIQQATLALGSGGLTGKGIGMGTIKYLYLPVSSSDSIFAVIGEELGLLGTGAVLGAYLLLLGRGLWCAYRAPDLLGSCLAAGITTSIVAQAMINMLVITGQVPVTGLPLPLISAGGTSHIFTMGMLGVLLNVARSSRWANR